MSHRPICLLLWCCEAGTRAPNAGLRTPWDAVHLLLQKLVCKVRVMRTPQVVRGVVLARKGLEVPVQQIASLQEGARLLPSDAYRACLSRVGFRV